MLPYLRRFPGWQSPYFLLVTSILILLCVGAYFYVHPALLENIKEDIAYAYDPTPERAFAYGTRHFEALQVDMYDLSRANYFFAEAFRLDPKFPLVNHQRARIAFLQGDLGLALERIEKEFAANPKPDPSSLYMRALIKGFMKDYDGAIQDYDLFFKTSPAYWGAVNDYSWVLLRAHHPEAALTILNAGLKQWPDHPLLMNNKATALYELGRYKEAQAAAQIALKGINEEFGEEEWLASYPGNDPLIASQGVMELRKSVGDNLAKINKALAAKN